MRDEDDVVTPQGIVAGTRLRMWRKENNYTADYMTRALETSRASYYRYENGFVMKLHTVNKIAAVLGKTFEETVAPL